MPPIEKQESTTPDSTSFASSLTEVHANTSRPKYYGSTHNEKPQVEKSEGPHDSGSEPLMRTVSSMSDANEKTNEQNCSSSTGAKEMDEAISISQRSTPCQLERPETSFRARPAFAEHLGKHREYWRDIILGVNDGLVSTFLLVSGVVGGGLSTNDILLTAVSGAIAGAVSMYAGEFIATKSQEEVMRGEIALENLHIQKYRSDEILELSELLEQIGIPGDSESGANLKQQLLDYYSNDGGALLKIMTALEFGVVEQERRSPCLAGVTSCTLFLLGSLPSVLPFALVVEPVYGLIVSAVGTGMSLFVVGAIKSWATRGSWISAATENLVFGGLGGTLAYGVGVGFDNLIHG